MAMIPEYDENEFHFDELPTTSAGVAQAAASPVTTPALILPRPAVATPTATIDVDPYEANVRKREKDYEEALDFAANDKDPAKLVSAAPAWYKGGPPPKQHVWGNSLTNMFGGMLSKPKELALANPDRPFGLKLQDARQLGALQGLQGLMSGFVNRKSDEYDRNQAAAAKEASMMKMEPGGSRSYKLVDARKALYEGALREKGMADLANLRKHNISKDEMMNSTDAEAVPQLAASREIMRQIRQERGLPDIDLSNTSLNSLQKMLTSFNAEMGLESRENSADAKAQNERNDIAARANEQRASEVARMKNEAAEARAQMDLGDDYVAIAPITKDSSTRNDIREAATVRDVMLQDLSRMKEIQHELNAMGRGFTGPWNQWIAGLEGTPEGDKAQALKLEADAIQHDLMTQERGKARGNMGVPQQFELQLTRNLFPAAGDPMAWIKGDHPWNAMISTIDRTTSSYLRKRGWGLRSKGDVEGAPFEPEVNTSPVAPVVSAKARRTGAAAPMPTSGDDLTLPPQVEAAVQAREAAPLPKVNEVLKKPAPKVEKAAAPAAAATPVDPQKEKLRSIIQQIESSGKKLTAEQAARLDALKKQAE